MASSTIDNGAKYIVGRVCNLTNDERRCPGQALLPFAARHRRGAANDDASAVRYMVDGALARRPLLSQSGVSPAARPDAGIMAAAAIEAVVRCAPLCLPADIHTGGWDVIELTFSLAPGYSWRTEPD